MDLTATITDKFISAIATYLEGLDWIYMISLMLLINVINTFFPDHIYKIGKFRLNFPTKYRVPTLAIILALGAYWFNGYTDRAHAVMYFQSMLAAMIFYLWFLDRLIKMLSEKVPMIAELREKLKVIKDTEPKK